jgi:hypothetical protein
MKNESKAHPPYPASKRASVAMKGVERGALMPSVLRNKMRLCTNKGVLEQHSEEEELSLAQLRQLFKRQNCQYDHASHAHDPTSSLLSASSSSGAMRVGGGGGGGAALEMADAIGIAETINKLAASLKDMAVVEQSSDGGDDSNDMAELQIALEQATKALQSFTSSNSSSRRNGYSASTEPTTMSLPTKDVTFYDGAALPPKSPLKPSNVQTPRRSNVSSAAPLYVVTNGCLSPQRLLQDASTALSCSSGFLATIGEDCSPPPTPGLLELMDEEEVDEEAAAAVAVAKPKKGSSRRKHGKKLSLDFKDFAGDKEGKKNIQITKGDIDIRIWGPSVGGLTLTTGGTSCSNSGENDSPTDADSTWVINRERKDNSDKAADKTKTRSRTKPMPPNNDDRQSCPKKPMKFPWQMKKIAKRERLYDEKGATTTRPDIKGAPSEDATRLENLVLGAMHNPRQHSTPEETASYTILRNKKSSKTAKKASVDAIVAARGRNDKHRDDQHHLLPAMSNLSYLSGVLPNRQMGEEKFKTVKTDHEKGFEVYLEDSTATSHYSPKKLRQRAAVSEKLLAKRREIMSIQQDLKACSQLLGKIGSKDTMRSNRWVTMDEEQKRMMGGDPPSAGTTNHNNKRAHHGAIIRE